MPIVVFMVFNQVLQFCVGFNMGQSIGAAIRGLINLDIFSPDFWRVALDYLKDVFRRYCLMFNVIAQMPAHFVRRLRSRGVDFADAERQIASNVQALSDIQVILGADPSVLDWYLDVLRKYRARARAHAALLRLHLVRGDREQEQVNDILDFIANGCAQATSGTELTHDQFQCYLDFIPVFRERLNEDQLNAMRASLSTLMREHPEYFDLQRDKSIMLRKFALRHFLLPSQRMLALVEYVVFLFVLKDVLLVDSVLMLGAVAAVLFVTTIIALVMRLCRRRAVRLKVPLLGRTLMDVCSLTNCYLIALVLVALLCGLGYGFAALLPVWNVGFVQWVASILPQLSMVALSLLKEFGILALCIVGFNNLNHFVLKPLFAGIAWCCIKLVTFIRNGLVRLKRYIHYVRRRAQLRAQHPLWYKCYDALRAALYPDRNNPDDENEGVQQLVRAHNLIGPFCLDLVEDPVVPTDLNGNDVPGLYNEQTFQGALDACQNGEGVRLVTGQHATDCRPGYTEAVEQMRYLAGDERCSAELKEALEASGLQPIAAP